MRAYLFPKTVKLIASARKGKIYSILFSWADSFIAAVSSLRIQLFRYSKKMDVQFEIIGKPDNETFSFAEKFKNRFVFGQGEKELTWIFDYPWISDENQEVEKKYPFSSVCESFKYQTVKIYQQNKLKAVFIFSLREGHLKTLFFWNTEGLENEIVQFLKLYSVKRKVEMLTVYHAEIAKFLFKSRFPFLWIKKYGQKIYSSFPVAGLENKKFQDGEGDFGFS